VDLEGVGPVLQFIRKGSLPAFRTGTKPAPSRYATGAAIMKPLASTPSTLSMRSPENRSANTSTQVERHVASPSSGVMSLKPIPGLGKSGISLMRSFSPATSYSMLTSVLRTAGQPMPPWSEGLAAGWVPRKSACSLQLGVLPATRRAPRNSARSPQLGAFPAPGRAPIDLGASRAQTSAR
jgi:hypothetical protein